MSAKSFEEWYAKERGNLALYTMDDDLRAAWTASRAALLADRPDVDALVDEIVTAARLQQFYDDPRFKPLSEQNWRAVDIAHKTIASRRNALEALAAQVADAQTVYAVEHAANLTLIDRAERAEAELAKLKALAEKMHAELKEYENSPFRHTSNSAWEYRAAYPVTP